MSAAASFSLRFRHQNSSGERGHPGNYTGHETVQVSDEKGDIRRSATHQNATVKLASHGKIAVRFEGLASQGFPIAAIAAIYNGRIFVPVEALERHNKKSRLSRGRAFNIGQ